MSTTTQKGTIKGLQNGKSLRAGTLLTTDVPTTPVPIPDGFNAAQKIINNSGIDVMVLDGFASSDTATEILFEQNLKLLSAGDGSTVVKNGSSATFLLNDDYYDSDDKAWKYSTCYNLLIVRTDNLFPVKIVGVLGNDDDSGYDDITITAGDAKTPGDYECMKESQAFQQNLMAYPDSVMASKFAAACNDSMDNSNTNDDIDTGVNAFFAQTDSYKQVTLNSLTAIQTYWEVFPYIWTGFAASKSYYLYSSDGTTVTYVGSLDITAPATVPASIDKTLKGFAFSFTPADTRQAKKTLQYVEGQFVDSVETTTVALKGLYQLKSQFTNNTADNVIIAYMTGSVNGAKVIGYDEKQQQSGSNQWAGFYSMLHPKDGAGWLALVLELGAIVMTLEMFSRPLKYLWDKYRESKGKNKGEDPSKTEADDMRADAKRKQSQDVADAQRTMDRMGTDITIKINLDINGSVAQVQTDRTNRVTEDSRSNYTDITNRQVDSVKTLSKYGMDTNIQKMSGEIGANKAALDPAKTTTEELAQKLDSVKANATNVHDALPAETTKMASKTSATEKQSLETAKEANEEALETQKEIDKNKDTSDKGDDSGVDTNDMPLDD